MKRIALLIVLAFILSSCSKEIDQSSLQKRGGLAYEVNSDKPFSGKVNTRNKEMDQGFLTYDDGILDGKFKIIERMPGRDKIIIEGEHQKGKLHGLVTTTYIQNGQRQSEVEYDNGVPKGTAKFWDEDGSLRLNKMIDYSKCSLKEKFAGRWATYLASNRYGTSVFSIINETDGYYEEKSPYYSGRNSRLLTKFISGNPDIVEYCYFVSETQTIKRKEEVIYCDYMKIITKEIGEDRENVWYRIAPAE